MKLHLACRYKDDLQYCISYLLLCNKYPRTQWLRTTTTTQLFTILQSTLGSGAWLISPPKSAYGFTRNGKSRIAAGIVWDLRQDDCDQLAARCPSPPPQGLAYSRAPLLPGFLAWHSRQQVSKSKSCKASYGLDPETCTTSFPPCFICTSKS